MRNRKTLFITGYAKLPSSITAYKICDVVCVAVEVEEETGAIIDADCSLATRIAKDFVAKLAVGYKLSEGIEGLAEEFEEYYEGSACKAIIMCFKEIYERFLLHQKRSMARENKRRQLKQINS